jgi:hypothetical protein
MELVPSQPVSNPAPVQPIAPPVAAVPPTPAQPIAPPPTQTLPPKPAQPIAPVKPVEPKKVPYELIGKTVAAVSVFSHGSVLVIDILANDKVHYYMKVSHGLLEVEGTPVWGTGTQPPQ